MEREIDLIELMQAIWSQKWFVLKIVGIFGVLGMLIAFTTPKEYKASSILIPESIGKESKLGGSLGGLASLAGVDLSGLSGSSQSINPALYQSVSRSTPFLIELMSQEYYFNEEAKALTIEEYFMEYYKTSLFSKCLSVPGKFLNFFRGYKHRDDQLTNPTFAISLSKDQFSIIENLKERVFVEMDWDLNIVTIEVEMQDPEVAARMTNFTQEYITRYVIDYAITKSTKQLESIEAQYLDRRAEFKSAQLRLASFRDNNKNINTSIAKSEEERLQSEYTLAFNIYNQLAQQREAIRLQVQQNTPVFTVLEPVRIPINPSSPRKMIILILSILFGGLLAGSLVLVKYTFHETDKN